MTISYMICILLPTEVSHFTKEEIKKSKDSPQEFYDNSQLKKNFHFSHLVIFSKTLRWNFEPKS